MSRILHRIPQAPKLAAAFALLASLFAMEPASAATAVYYQRAFQLGCNGVQCQVTLPKVAAGKQLIIHNITCYLGIDGNGSPRVGALFFTYAGNDQLVQFLEHTQVPAIGYFTKDLDVLIAAQKTAQISLVATTKALYASCTVLGRMQTL